MKKKRYFGRGVLTLLAAGFALLFLMPTVLTITNSLMTQSEISANYGEIFESAAGNGSTYVSEKVNLKFIPDKVSISLCENKKKGAKKSSFEVDALFAPARLNLPNDKLACGCEALIPADITY